MRSMKFDYKACDQFSMEVFHTTLAAHYLVKYALYNSDCIYIEKILLCIFVVLTFNLLLDFY